jgi:hypothetical protein
VDKRRRGKGERKAGREARGKEEKRGGGEEGGKWNREMNVRFFINPDPPVKASPAARIELTLGMYILFVVCCLLVIR